MTMKVFNPRITVLFSEVQIHGVPTRAANPTPEKYIWTDLIFPKN